MASVTLTHMNICTSALHNIAYHTAGQPDAPRVLLIMGYGMRGDAWRRQIPALSAHFNVTWFDHAGLGNSGPLGVQRLTMDHLVRDTVAVMDALEWDNGHVIGISMGGMIAQNLALHIPKKLRSLTLIATHAGGMPRGIPPLQGIQAFARANFSSDRIGALAELLFPEDFLRTNRALAIEMLREDFQGPPPTRTRLAQLHAIQTHRTAHRLSELTMPTLVVQPGKDILIHPANSEELARLIPRAVLERIPDAGHGIVRQSADELNAILLEHLLGN